LLRFLQHPRVLEISRYFGYSLFFVLVLLLSIPVTFPTRQLKSFLARQARAQGYPLEIEDLSLHGLGGIEIAGMRLTLPGKEGQPGENGQMGPATPEAELRIDKLTARVALMPALFGKTIDVTFDVEAGGGKLEGGHVVRKGESIDVEIAKLDGLGLGEMGIGGRALAGQKLTGELDGSLNGNAKVHWGGSTEDLTGAVDLELVDALLKSPELNLEGGLKLTDLSMGTLTLKVRMGLKSSIAALANQRGAEKSTMVHIEQMEAVGDQLELITDETSHILIPPGKGGWRAATIQLHFAFALPDKPAKGKGDKAKDKKAKGDAGDEDTGDAKKDVKPEVSDRLKWASILTMAGAKLKPFERNGFIGIGCVGPVARPQCKPELPTVTTGTRGKGETGPGGPTAPRAEEKKPETPPTAEPTPPPTPAPEPPPPVINTPQPVMPPEPRQEAPPAVEQPAGQVERPGDGRRPPPQGQDRGQAAPGEAPAEGQGGEGNQNYDEGRPRGGSGNRQDPDENKETPPPEEPKGEGGGE
jgi:type II secretion system protein N